MSWNDRVEEIGVIVYWDGVTPSGVTDPTTFVRLRTRSTINVSTFIYIFE